MGDARIDVVWDTDIGRDPDDFLAGCFLLSRQNVRLRAITISPGDHDQVALTRLLLKETGHAAVPIGTVPDREKGKKSVSGCHLRLMEYYKATLFDEADGAGWEVLATALRASPEAVLFTSGPLNNVGDLLRKTDLPIGLSVSMAGYWAGPGEPASKPEFNFNGCGWAAREFVESKRFGKRTLVGKNVTHQVLYNEELHHQIREAGKQSRPLALAAELMALRSPSAKKLHDVLAAAAIVIPNIFTWEEVQPIKRNNEWSSTASPGTGIWATTSVDIPTFRGLFATESAL